LLGPSSSALPYRAVNVIITVDGGKVRIGRNPSSPVTKFSPSSYLGVRKSGQSDILCKVYTALEIRIIVRRNSSVDIASRYGLDDPGIESRWGVRFSLPVQAGPGAHPASCTVDTDCLSPGLTRPGRDFDHPPHIAPRLKKE
jgi:hypothetical protein